ncbi:LacI family DNA-binding transcriptional regulator [Massilibacteroides sp.]|uniref:LacI family DNA-binding transcriptional regulator n=1 Tax=Massilibacteroides sp. TaxID=2034766 RepID=UPI0026133555|nr:LacI family DNA-binding transcriptional regulator [Massilibacteroides sp.]MDD4515936.1 LacI family DNA-binding transcriptional regulator [Massilibacteroides sp.]
MKKNYRIKDIAELSGVSTGTVDRILHKRGKVSTEAREKVEKVLKEIDYHPNLIARSLALKKQYHFITVTPIVHTGAYWEQLCMGIEAAENDLFSYNVKVRRLYFDQYDKNSFDELIPQIENSDCQGVVIATLFKEGVLNLTKVLDEKEIPYVLIDAYIEGTHAVAYYGTPSFDSGYIAGRLIYNQLKANDDIVVFKFSRIGNQISTQVQIREEGFRTYLSEKNYQGRIHHVHIHAGDDGKNKEIVDEFMQKYPEVNMGIIFNSKAYLIGDYLENNETKKEFRLVGYDAIDKNIHYLKNGRVTHLIAQRPEVQGLNCIKALFRHLVLKEKNELINHMPIDILMKENIQYYNNYI